MSKYWRSLERVKNVKKKKPNLGALHTLVRVVLTTRLGKKEIGGWGAEGAQTCACAPSADELGSTSTEEEAHDCHLPSFSDSPLVGLREANIYISIYEECVKVCVFIAFPGILYYLTLLTHPA